MPKVTPRTGIPPSEGVDREALRAASQFVGEVGQEVTLEIRVNHVSDPFPSQYGDAERYVYLVGDADRNAIRIWGGKTFAQANGLRTALRKGDRVEIRGTVSKQEEYKGEKQTTLNRVTVLRAL